jgi:hypothetical protein
MGKIINEWKNLGDGLKYWKENSIILYLFYHDKHISNKSRCD